MRSIACARSAGAKLLSRSGVGTALVRHRDRAVRKRTPSTIASSRQDTLDPIRRATKPACSRPPGPLRPSRLLPPGGSSKSKCSQSSSGPRCSTGHSHKTARNPAAGEPDRLVNVVRYASSAYRARSRLIGARFLRPDTPLLLLEPRLELVPQRRPPLPVPAREREPYLGRPRGGRMKGAGRPYACLVRLTSCRSAASGALRRSILPLAPAPFSGSR